MSVTTISIESVRRANNGFNWFDPDTMRFFRTRLGQSAYRGAGGIYFVTSEQFNDRADRLYSVRMQRANGNIETVGDGFQAYTTRRAATKVAKQLAAG